MQNSHNSHAPILFQEVCAIIREHFYDPKFTGIDWDSYERNYTLEINSSSSQAETAEIINQFLSELKISHTRLYTCLESEYFHLLSIFRDRGLYEQIQHLFPDGQPTYIGIGIFTQNINNKIFITSVINGGPADHAGFVVGDQILSVNGNHSYSLKSFVDKESCPVQVNIRRHLGQEGVKTLTVTPIRIEPISFLLEAMQNSIEIIAIKNKNLGYIHVWSYSGEKFHNILTKTLMNGDLKDVDGLILDFRDGWGGADPMYLSLFTSKPIHLIDGIPFEHDRASNFHWRKPVVMLVNQQTRSGKEVLAYGFQKYQIGKVIGTRTAGAVINGRPFLLSDNSLLYLAVSEVRINGERLEGKGVKPDLEVPFCFEYSEGIDPQKQKAVEVLISCC
jgi:carboxyl-terminal processing protease